MEKSGFTKGRKSLLIVLVLTVITVGGVFMFSMLGKSQEERRNREYEMSLVDTLKDTYEGIEEVHISTPSYATIPSEAWGASVKVVFSDKKQVSYKMAYNKDRKEIRSRDFQDSSRQEDNQYLISHQGTTNEKVIVYYSDGEKGEQ